MAVSNNEFRIGSDAGSADYLFDLDIYEPTWEPPFASRRDNLGDGIAKSTGWLEATWYWKFLSRDAYDQLRAICPAGTSSVTAYIRTKTTSTNFANYTCVMIWPVSEVWDNDFVMDFELRFRKMVNV